MELANELLLCTVTELDHVGRCGDSLRTDGDDDAVSSALFRAIERRVGARQEHLDGFRVGGVEARGADAHGHAWWQRLVFEPHAFDGASVPLRDRSRDLVVGSRC